MGSRCLKWRYGHNNEFWALIRNHRGSNMVGLVISGLCFEAKPNFLSLIVWIGPGGAVIFTFIVEQARLRISDHVSTVLLQSMYNTYINTDSMQLTLIDFKVVEDQKNIKRFLLCIQWWHAGITVGGQNLLIGQDNQSWLGVFLGVSLLSLVELISWLGAAWKAIVHGLI